MPKKRLNKTLQTKPSSSAPATLTASTTGAFSHGRSAAASGSKPAPSSVNELINHLRQTQLSDDQLHRLPHTPTAATVHPSLRSILSVPDTPPPRPRPENNIMRPSGPTRMRRIPGPPPPASWLAASSHANTSQDCKVLTRRRVEQSSNLPGGRFPTAGSFQHMVLKALATNPHWLSEYDSVHLLPTQLKQTILSYVAVYHEEPERSQNKPSNPFRLLFPKLSADDALLDVSIDDNSEVSRLDLGGAIGRWLSMKEFKELIYMSKIKVVRKEPDILPDSWDDECVPYREEVELPGEANAETDTVAAVSAEGGSQASREGHNLTFGSGRSATMVLGQEVTSGAASGWPKTLENMSLRFSNLAHLSLALSPTTTPLCKRTAASWLDLLKVAPSLSRLSSLSLAHWPSPTLTPHAASTYTTIKNPVSASLPGIPYGGSDMYTSYDGEWTEAANLLKILSRHLYCLQWLDLSGCGEWFAALSAANGAEWTGAWRGIEQVGLCVGWLPELAEGVGELEPQFDPSLSTACIPVLDAAGVHHPNYNRTSRGMHDVVHSEDEEIENERKKYYHKKAVEKYMEIVSISRHVASSIHATRKGLGRWIDFDLSPELPVVRDD